MSPARAVPARSSGAEASRDWKRTTVRPFRYVRPHAGRFDVHFHDEEAVEALTELVEYREAWRSKLEAVRREADERRVRIEAGAPRPERDGVRRVGSAVRAFVRRPSREAVLLTYELEDLRRTLETLDDAIRRLEEYIARRSAADAS